ncbi:sensor histidine kinase [Nonomuraea sp. NPDC050153]|uniref:sensor histidine kinase n=1 Tax=Nonomuraea sp. NPDC050153 TaxID=3364359 RepID=UPI0037ACEDCD
MPARRGTAQDRLPADGITADLHPDGRFRGGSAEVFRILGLAQESDVVRVPGSSRTAWGAVAGSGAQYRLRPHPDRPGWEITLFPAPAREGHRATLRRLQIDNLASVAQSKDLSTVVHNLTIDFFQASELVGPMIVLVDPSGSPTFAGSHEMGHDELAAMERCRRNGAPMLTLQAFEEDRVIVDPAWYDRVRVDDRFAPIRAFVGLTSGFSYLSIPLRTSSGPFGVVAGSWPAERPITPGRVRLWCDVADRLALALQYSELMRRARVQGADIERQRINDDLHATLAQDLFVLALHLAKLEAGDLENEHRATVLEVRRLTEQLVVDVRMFIGERRHVMEGVGMAEYVDDLAKDLGGRTGIAVDVRHAGDVDAFSSDFNEDVARIVQEAFRNVDKHALASRVSVHTRLDPESKMFVLEISDDGRTGKAGAAVSTGAGLSIVSEIAARRGGDVTIRQSGGTTVIVRIVPEYESEWAVAQRSLEPWTG